MVDLDPTVHERLAALEALGVVDTPPEARFDRITSLASRLLGMPISLIGLIDNERQWNKSQVGMPEVEWPLADSICRYVVASDAPFEVEDLSADPRFVTNSFVLRGVRFYAGWPLRDGAGVPLGALCVLDNAPHRLRPDQRELMESLALWAQAELNAEVLSQALTDVRHNEQRLMRLLDEAPEAVLIVGTNAKVEFANFPAGRLLGSDQDSSPVGRTVTDLLPDATLGELRAQGRRSTDVGSPGRRFVQRGRRGDGSSFTAELTVSAAAGPLERYIIFVRDLSAEHVGEAALAELRLRTEAAFDALAEGVLVVEPDGRLSFGNLAAARMVQMRRVDLTGGSFHQVLHPEEAEESVCQLRDPISLAGRTISAMELRRPDGTTLPVELAIRLLRSTGSAPGVVVTMHDLTERLRTERMKNELVSAVSHELRTPLTSIRGSLSLLRAGVIDPASEQGARMIEIATASTERLSRLVDDILDLERLQAGRVRLELGREHAHRLMLSAAQSVSGAAVAAGVRIDVHESDEWLIADQDRVVQILVNLLGNAIKFSPHGSLVEMSVERRADRVRLSVADEGRGIPAHELGRIFDRFAQVDSGDSREFEGTGLGLAIAKGLAEQHDGTLTATSTTGEGSTFVLDLPAAAARRRLLAYAPADVVPEELAQLLATRGWEVRAARIAGLEVLSAGAVMLAAAGPDEVEAVRQRALELDLPLLAVTFPVLSGPARLEAGDVVATVRSEDVLIVEDDEDLAGLLAAALAEQGLTVRCAPSQESALGEVRRQRPDLIVLDVRLQGGDGFGVVDGLREQGLGRADPILVYSVLDLDDAEQARLQTGGTSFLIKGRHQVQDVVSDVVRLLDSRTHTRRARDIP